MDKMERRKFLKVAGAGVAGAAAVGALGPLAGMVISVSNGGQLRFRAVTGLPKRPFPAYASYVLDGSVDLLSKTGTVTQALYAGAPETISQIVLPGTARTVRVTDVLQSDGLLRITGVVDDLSQLHRGESPTVEIMLDRSKGQVQAQFFGTNVSMRLEDASR